MKHKEAYAIMNYRCECGHHELVWNSRDGVTPFCIPCPVCKDGMGMCHVDFKLDRFSIRYQVPKGHRYFATMTMERARFLAARNVDHGISLGHIPEARRNFLIGNMTRDYYGDGTFPDILVKE